MKKYRLRFHLGRGPNYKKWQLRHPNGSIEFFDPNTFSYTIYKGTLNNNVKTATRIFNGENKTVCSWISFDNGTHKHFNPSDIYIAISYNPKVSTHWFVKGNESINIDGFQGTIYIKERSLYVPKEELINFLNTHEKTIQNH